MMISKMDCIEMAASGGNGYCDCGDVEAWTAHPACELHKVQQDEEQNSTYGWSYLFLYLIWFLQVWMKKKVGQITKGKARNEIKVLKVESSDENGLLKGKCKQRR